MCSMVALYLVWAYAHGDDTAEGYLGGLNWREKVSSSLPSYPAPSTHHELPRPTTHHPLPTTHRPTAPPPRRPTAPLLRRFPALPASTRDPRPLPGAGERQGRSTGGCQCALARERRLYRQ